MPTPSDDQRQIDRSDMIAASVDPSALSPQSTDATGVRMQPEQEVVYELQENDFILDPDETTELPTGPQFAPAHVPRVPELLAPPVPELLPPWAAASRALLNGWSQGEPQPMAANGSHTASELREAREDLVRFARQLYAREVYFQEVERALVVAQARVRGQAFRVAELELSLRELSAAAAANVSSPRPAAVRARPAAPAGKHVKAASRDDLEQIRGIGPSLAKRLHKLGMASFESVAAWKAKDLERIAKELKVTRERIEREGWVKQARALRTRAR